MHVLTLMVVLRLLRSHESDGDRQGIEGAGVQLNL